MRKFLTLSAISAAALAASSPASATVVYNFDWPGGAISFSLTADDFLTGTGTLSAAELDSCTHFLGPCTGLEYDDTTGISGVEDGFDLLFTFADNGDPGTTFFGFEDGTFSTPGTYFNGFWTLTVSESNSAVAEPSTWAMMLIGFGAAGFVMRRRKQAALAFRRAA